MKVYVVMGASGTSPSDSMDWCERVYLSKEAAETYCAEHSQPSYPIDDPRAWGPGSGGPWYTVEEHDVQPLASYGTTLVSDLA